MDFFDILNSGVSDDGLAINTDSADRYKQIESECLDELRQKWNCQIFHTPVKSDAIIDGVISRDNTLTACFEHRNRNDEYKRINNYGSVILTYHKLQAGIFISRLLRVPFLFIIYFIPDKQTYYFKVTDEKGIVQFPISIDSKITQKSINQKQTLNRNNAFLPIQYIFKL